VTWAVRPVLRRFHPFVGRTAQPRPFQGTPGNPRDPHGDTASFWPREVVFTMAFNHI
jgi:hypothetical protein